MRPYNIRKIAPFAAIASLIALPFCGGDDASINGPDSGGSPDSSATDSSSLKDSSITDAPATDASDAGSSDGSMDSSVPPDAADSSVADAADSSVADAGGVCSSNSDCAKTDFCDKPVGKCSGKGKCTAIPFVCSKIISPVCGCDKVTYKNGCLANQASESEDYAGACE